MKKLPLIVIGLLMFLFMGFFAVLIAGTAWGKHLFPERHYQDIWCANRGGQVEVRQVDGTRVDCLTDTHAIEFDFGSKWAESAGQALYYSAMTGKKAGIVLIMEDPEKDQKYLDRLKKLIEYHGLDITVWVMRPNKGGDK